MPLEDNRFDVVISNCVLNLVPDKRQAFAEIKRVLKPGGHLCFGRGNQRQSSRKIEKRCRNVCGLRVGSHRLAGIFGYYRRNGISKDYSSQTEGSATAGRNFKEISRRGRNPTV